MTMEKRSCIGLYDLIQCFYLCYVVTFCLDIQVALRQKSLQLLRLCSQLRSNTCYFSMALYLHWSTASAVGALPELQAFCVVVPDL